MDACVDLWMDECLCRCLKDNCVDGWRDGWIPVQVIACLCKWMNR